MANTYLLTAGQSGGVRNGQFTIDTTATSTVPGAGASDIYQDVFSTAQNASGVGTVIVTANVKSTAVMTFYQTSSPIANINAGTAIWSVISGLSGVTGQAANVGTTAVITGPITAISYTITTALAGLQANVVIHAGYPSGKPASY